MESYFWVGREKIKGEGREGLTDCDCTAVLGDDYAIAGVGGSGGIVAI